MAKRTIVALCLVTAALVVIWGLDAFAAKGGNGGGKIIRRTGWLSEGLL